MQVYNARLTTAAIARSRPLNPAIESERRGRELSKHRGHVRDDAPVSRSLNCMFAESAGQVARRASGSPVRRHQNRKAESGEMVQRLVDADQRPEPGMLILLRHPERRRAKSLGAIDGDMNDEVDHRDKPESRRDHHNEDQRNYKVYETMCQQRQGPAGLLIFSDRHPGILQDEIGDDVLEREQQHPSYQRGDRDGG